MSILTERHSGTKTKMIGLVTLVSLFATFLLAHFLEGPQNLRPEDASAIQLGGLFAFGIILSGIAFYQRSKFADAIVRAEDQLTRAELATQSASELASRIHSTKMSATEAPISLSSLAQEVDLYGEISNVAKNDESSPQQPVTVKFKL